MSRFDDIYTKSKKNSKEETKPEAPNASGRFGEILNRTQSGGVSFSGIDENYINTFISDSNLFLSSAEEEYGKIGWGNASSVYESRKNTLNDLNARSSNVRAWLNYNKDKLDADTYKSLLDNLDNFYTGASSILSTFEEASKYYSQWETEADYRSYLEQAKNYEELLSYDLDAGAKEIAGLSRVRDQYQPIANLYGNYNIGTVVLIDQKPLKETFESYYGPGTYDYYIKTGELPEYGANYGLGGYDPSINDGAKSDEYGNLLDENGFTTNGKYISQGSLKNLKDNYADFYYKYGSYEDLLTTIAQKEQYYNQAKRTQEGAKLASVSGNADFDEYNDYVSTENDGLGSKLLSQYGMGYEDLIYEYINGAENGMRSDILHKAIAWNASDSLGATGKFTIYDYLTEDEIGIYNYYYAKEGKEAAEKYLDSIQETLNYRQATDMYDGMEGNVLLELVFGVAAGLDQFESGIKNLFNFKDDYIPPSATQIASGMVREDLADAGPNLPQWLGGASLGQVGYDAITTTANMVPSIVTSWAVGMINPVAGQVVGNTLMGASAAGNAYQEALNLGYDKGQARAYSTLVGASEAGLQYLLGGVSNLGGKLSGNVVTKIANGVDNAFARTAIKLGGNMLSEGIEEGLQEILTPWFKSLTLHTNEDVNWSEVAYSTLLGALTAGFMEGGSTISGEVKTYKTGKQLQAADISAERLAEIGTTFSADTVAYQLAGSVNENTGAYTMGRLFNEIGATLTEQNVTEITNALTAKGMDYETAKKNAKALAYVVEGGQLSEKQIAVIEANEVLAEVARTTLIDANTTWNQRSIGYNEMLKSLADEMTSPKASRTKQAQQSVENAPTADTVDVQTENGTESVSEVESVDTSPAKVKSIANIEKGQVTIKLEDDTEVSVKDADLSPDDGVRIETIASIDGISAEDANFILNTLRTNTNASAQMDSLGAKEAYKYGFYGFSQNHMTTHGVFSNSLTETQRKSIYETGRNARQKQVEAKQVTVSKATGKKSLQAGKVHFEGDRSSLTERQSASLTAIEKVAEALGVQIYVFESKLNESGKRVGANGWYDPKDGSIHIDLHAGANGEGTMLFTAAHELTHFIRQWSPAKFKTLADFLMQEYGKKGVNMDALVREQMAKAKRNGRTISYDTAYEEVVADSMEMMLSDGKVIEKLARLKEQDKALWQKIKDFINELAAKIRAVYEGMAPDSVEGRHVAEMVDAIERLQDLFAEGLVEASENYQASEEILAESGIAVDSETDSGSLFSVRDVLDDADRNKVAKALAERFDVTVDEAKKWLSAETSLASLILNPKYSRFLDYEADPGETAIKQNSDYPQGTVDFSNICKKRREFTQVMNRVLRNFPNHVFAATDLAKIRTIMGEEGMTLPCGICYVEDRRQLDTIVAQDFIDGLKLYREGSKTRPDGKLFNANQLKGLQLTDGDTYVPTIYELVSLEGRNSLKAKNPNMEAAWVKYNNARGMQSVRLLTNEAEYKRQILKYSKSTVQSKNDKGGLRIYSFSDAEMFHLIDIIQVITDSAAVGLSLQGYTKVNEYAKAVKDTGEKLNRSLIPKGDLGYHIKDGKVILDYDTVEGIDITSEDFFDNKDNPNVGNITIGVNDIQIRAAMVSDFVDQIIPFHTGQSEEVLGEKGIAAWKNYKDFQTEKDIATGKTSGHQVNIYTEVIQAAEKEGKPIQNKRQFVEKFLEVCKENGLQPRFSDFLNTDAQGNYIYTEGYHKFLVDFKTFAQTEVGEYLPQMPVKPIFDNAYITGLLKAYVKEQQVKDVEVAKSMPKVIERITNEIIKPAESDTSKFSIREEFYKEYDAWDRKDNNVSFVVGTTSDALLSVGMKDQNIVLRSGTVLQKIKDHPEMTFDIFKGIPELLEHPIIVQFSDAIDPKTKRPKYDSSITVLGELYADVKEDGKTVKKPVLVSLELLPTNQKKTAVLDFAIIKSAYSKNALQQYLNENSILYIDPDKKRTDSWLSLNRLQLPLGEKSYGPIRKIAYVDGKVKVQNSKNMTAMEKALLDAGVIDEFGNKLFSDRDSDGNTLSTAQAEFFRDSKVRDAAGNLLVVYHGTPKGSTTIFDKSKTSKDNDMGQGIYFSTNKGDASTYMGKSRNKKLYSTYVNIKAPFVVSDDVKITVSEAASLLKLCDDRMMASDVYREIKINAKDGYITTSQLANTNISQSMTEILEKSGKYDGIIDETVSVKFGLEKGTKHIIALSSNQIKSIENKTPTSNDDIRYSDRNNVPTFYSQMAKIIEGVKQEKLGAASVVNMLRGKGVKAEEIKWSGIETWLEGKKSVTKAELQEFIAGSMLQIIEEQSDTSSVALRFKGDNTYKLYDADGNVLDTFIFSEFMGGYISEKTDEIYTDYYEIEDAVRDEYGNQSLPRWSDYTLSGGFNYREIVFRLPNSSYSNRAMRVHWGDEAQGVLAHARIQDFDTSIGKMLFIEEIQSDWHNEGHRKGYVTNEYEEAAATADKLYNEYIKVKQAFNKYARSSEFRTDPDDVRKKKYDWLRQKMDAADKKRLEAERIVDSIKEKGAGEVEDAPFRDNYHEYVLKRLIREAAEKDYDSIGWTTAEIQSRRYSEDFAEAYRIEYDQDIPKFLRKYGKKWGTDVSKTTIKGYDVWHMPITDSMKESVMTEGQPLYQDRSDESVSNRSLLANALEGVAQNEIERNKIQEYKGKISLINSEEQKLHELNEQIKELSFSKGPRDTKKIRDLQIEAKQTANRISTYDKQLLRLEASKPLQDVLTREKKMAYQRAEQKGKEALSAYKEKAAKTQRELLDKWKESRKKGIESREKTAMRHKIQSVVGELNQLLLSNDKKRHVPENLKKAVADALALVNMDTVGAEERAAKYAALIAKETDPDKIDAYTVTMENILRQGEKMGQRLKELRDAYEEIQNSDDPDIANAYDPVIAGSLQELAQSIGNTSLRNMTIDQLQDVYDMYKMVLTRVRDANKSLIDSIKETIANRASRVVGEVKRVGGEHKYRVAILDFVKKFGWDNLKPVYAFEHIGSATLTDAFNQVRAGEDTWAMDVSEAREYYLDKSKKYGYDSWDFKKKYRFKSTSETEFELTLEQILSLYAYSKREQAHDHLRLGGFVFDSNIETYKDQDGKRSKGILKYKVNTADAHQISPEILASITGTLSKEQMAFVDEMQEYLSTVMGAKGNEITMKMYGVKLFKEKFYFPLKSAKQFMFEQNEVSGEVRIKNSGFTNKVVAKANNPVILSNFMDVWANHVNDMSMYHSFVLPLEDFNRIFNYNSPKQEGKPPVSVKGTIQNAYSPAAVGYVRQLITDLNGGARSDSTTGIINKMIGLFKKGSVFASLSVVVQQPSAIARAAALVDTKYFIGPKVDHKRHKALWDEVKQYAPVAIIKEMGYFDTNMGKSTQDFITGKEYSGFKEKMKALVVDSNYRDEVLSKAPALADEIAWCSIWEAVKRETAAKNPGMDVKSEAFLNKAGERFTEVITKTQVYDSVLSRSGLMRSKDTGMKMATAFMAEPTTSINMVTDALLQGKRGNKKYARTAIGAVIASQILNSILVSFVYAGRDDDEDETYLEKYIGTLSGEILDSLNPAGYIPFIKDIMSIVQGYDVERSDMAVVSDLWNAIQNLSKDNVSGYRKVEGFAGSIAQIFGLPVKNIMRDARGIYQTIDSFVNGQQTTKAGIGYAVKGAITGKTVSNEQQLYEAILSGDQAQIARVKSRFEDASAVSSAIRKALRENDPRIHEAAVAWNANDLDEYMRIAKQIIAEKHFSQDDVVMAIRAEANALKPDTGTTSTSKAKGLFTAEKFAEAIAQGDEATANAIKIDIIQTAQKNGKTEEEAEENFVSTVKSELKELFLSGKISEDKVVDALVAYCDMDESEAELKVESYVWEAQGYEGATSAAVRDYNTFCAASNVPKDVYLYIRSFSNNTENDKDANGKSIAYSAMKKVMAEINAQAGLTSAQKTAIARSLGWAEKNIQKYKTW